MFGVIGLLVFIWICWLLIRRFGIVNFFLFTLVMAVATAVIGFITHFFYA